MPQHTGAAKGFLRRSAVVRFQIRLILSAAKARLAISTKAFTLGRWGSLLPAIPLRTMSLLPNGSPAFRRLVDHPPCGQVSEPGDPPVACRMTRGARPAWGIGNREGKSTNFPHACSHDPTAPPTSASQRFTSVTGWFSCVTGWFRCTPGWFSCTTWLVPFHDWLVPFHDWLVPFHDWMVPFHDWMVQLRDWLVPFHDWMVQLHDRLVRLREPNAPES